MTRARVGRTDVADDEEAVRQPARRVEQREVLLVRLHRQDQAFLRHLEKVLVEAADEHVRPLDQRRHLVEQRRVVDRRAAGLLRGARQLRRDLVAPLVEARDHRALVAQLRGVAVGVAQLDRRARGLEAMARACAGRRSRPSA